MFIFSICFCAYINLEQNKFLNFIIIDQCYFMEFENKKKASEITLLACILAMFYKYLISIIGQKKYVCFRLHGLQN